MLRYRVGACAGAYAPTVIIPGSRNGALGSGHGGYSAGVFAECIDGPAEVSLRRPVPLDTELTVVPDGEIARVLHGSELVAEVEPAGEIALDVPRASIDEAREAAGRYGGPPDEVFASCYVCGPKRDDSFHIFAGPVPGRALVACPWTPPAWAADDDGRVLPEHVWAALDCPTYFASHLGTRPR